MKAQNITGKLTEGKVRNCLKAIGLIAEKPIPDKGIDLEVYHPNNSGRKINIQIKGRGENQKSGKYRWFQIRTSPKQRAEAVKLGLTVSELLEKKVRACDFFILVPLKYDNEMWVFPKDIILEIISINKEHYKNRKDNNLGHQAEMNLDIADSNGKPLYERYSSYRNNLLLIKDLAIQL